MKLKTTSNLLAFCAALLASVLCPATSAAAPVNVSLRSRSDAGKPSARSETWEGRQTAIIICDMWDKHWCAHATARVGELAPRMNAVLTNARGRGVTIVHAPSDCVGAYNSHPSRAKLAPFRTGPNAWEHWSDSETAGLKRSGLKNIWPVMHPKNGCWECGRAVRHWNKQIATLTVKPEDLVSDHGGEIIGYLKSKGVKNVIVMGVHTNMCVIGRPFGLRAMKKNGFNTALMRDMTDLMYNSPPGGKLEPVGVPLNGPGVEHFEGLNLMVQYIEKYVAPSVASTTFTGKTEFRFAADKTVKK
ncbi:MAG: isochorismatase family protein [Puniceicoccales bacterium]|jgi:nicotinamidase-related amidase|nr:isochorismatase family protein [Puniceicoccales bacterium]